MLHDFILEAVADALVVILIEHHHVLRGPLLGRGDLEAAGGEGVLQAKVLLAGSMALLGLRSCVRLGVISVLSGRLGCL